MHRFFHPQETAVFDILELSLSIDDYALAGLELPTLAGWTRLSTLVRLRGCGLEGRGEDVTYQAADAQAFQAQGPVHDLAGTYTLDEFSRRLDGLQLFPTPPADPKATLYRRWAFESAALDLALRQAGQSLPQALEREARPMRFVVSLGLGSPPSLARLEALWERDPTLELKLDADPSWDEALIAQLQETNRVTTVDLKGQYKGPFKGMPPNADLYRRIAAGLPQAWLEDPGWTEETRVALAPHLDRVTYDAPFCSLSDLEQYQPRPRCLNVKPSRFGRLREVLRVYSACEAQGIEVYGGGQFELGPGRLQAQLLASVFHPNTANDLAPVAFHADDLPAQLPSSPLTLPHAPGFAPLG
ncbi:MAG: hypothetical protein JKY65_32415 [Planctomycetes bacterium]|nr:hypothetical protein [Planctomycetota bacterium]